MALSSDGKARAGMGVDVGDFDNSGRARPGDHQLRRRDDRPLPAVAGRHLSRHRRRGRRRRSRRATIWDSAALFADLDLDGRLDLVIVNGHIDDTVRNIRGNVGYAQRPQLFLNQGNARVSRCRRRPSGAGFAQPRVGRGLAFGDFDRDGDVDVLITTNNGPAVLLRNDQTARQPQRAVPAGRAPRPTATPSAARSASSTTASRSRGWSRAARAICRSPSCR